MKYTAVEICMQEVPGEVCVAFSISNCPFTCPGCHSAELQTDVGTILSTTTFKEELDFYRAKHTGNYLFSCALFFGGDQHEQELVELLKFSHSLGIKTCLYTGFETVSDAIKEHLDYLKVGPYNKAKGDLMSKTTNQRLIDLNKNKDITYKFWENT